METAPMVELRARARAAAATAQTTWQLQTVRDDEPRTEMEFVADEVMAVVGQGIAALLSAKGDR